MELRSSLPLSSNTSFPNTVLQRAARLWQSSAQTVPETTVQDIHTVQDINPNDEATISDIPLEAPPATDPPPKKQQRFWSTIALAAQDVRSVLNQQRQQGQLLTTKLNILFVVNGALLTSLTLSRLMFIPSPFSMAEIVGFLVNFTLLINAFLPRQIAISPNLGDNKFLERYLTLTPEEYQLRMMVNLVHTYQANQQRIDDVSQTLNYAAYVTWAIAFVIMMHTVVAFFFPALQYSYSL